MKRSIVFLFMFFVMGLVTMAQPPQIRIPGATPKPTPPPIRVPKETPEQEMAKRQGHFPVNTSFVKDKKYFSEDNRYFFLFQSDGNLVVYKVAGGKAVWNSRTNGRAVKSCVFQADGNLVMYDYTGKAVWDSNTDTKNKDKGFGKGDRFFPAGGNWMVIQSDGNLVVYGGSYPYTGSPRWSSNSFERN